MQRWYIDNKEILVNDQSLEKIGLKEYTRLTIIEYKSLEFYGFTKETQIKRDVFKDFFIEDDRSF